MKQNNLQLALIFLFIVTIKQEPAFKQLYPLAGTWEMEAGGKHFYENWQIKGANEMYGNAYRISATDTVELEDVKITAKNNVVYYIPIVKGQNDGQAVSFKLTGTTPQKFVFENPEHDFPQRVIYHLITNDSLHAWIEGKQNGKEKRSDFYCRRVK